MDKVLLLKTQLAEASKFAQSSRFEYKRLAVILLDNFVEIQLNSLIEQKFHYDTIASYYNEKRYSEDIRENVLKHYDLLLKICVKESIITPNEKRLLSFCHNVRNNLYHKIHEEELLTLVAIHVLQDVITKYQPEWKTARDFTLLTVDFSSPYDRPSSQNLNSRGNWEDFMEKHFNCVEEQAKNASELLSKYLETKLKEIRGYIDYIRPDYNILFPSATWDYNELLFHYSFLITHDFDLQKLKESKDEKEIAEKSDQLYLIYKTNWKYKKIDRLTSLEKSIEKIADLPIEKSIEKFFSIKDEVEMIYGAFSYAISDLDDKVENSVNR